MIRWNFHFLKKLFTVSKREEILFEATNIIILINT